jgi:hypothetical protein
MKHAIASLIFSLAVASGQTLTISADTTTLAPGGKAKLSLKQGSATPTATWTVDGDTGLSADNGSSTVYTAPAQDGKLVPTGYVTVTATLADGTTKATIELCIHAPGSWESRSIVGFSQSAASSSDPRQAFFLDFFIERGLDKVSAVDANFTLWGNIRLASVPQQINAPVSALTKDLGAAAKALQLNQLVQSAEFLTGLEYRLWKPSDTSTKRDIGLIVQYGETGPLQPKDTLQLFALPDPTSSQYPSFVHSYGTPPATAKYAGFTSPDRGSFFKQYGFGFRVSTFSLSDPETPPATYSFTVGQDQTVTGGRYHGLVGRVDVFYPLPISIGNPDFKFIYLFGTVNTRFSGRPVQTDPLILAPAPTGTNGYDNNVMLVTSASNRDTYRIGIGLDALSLLKKLKVSTK